jgi:hypothetical protein
LNESIVSKLPLSGRLHPFFWINGQIIRPSVGSNIQKRKIPAFRSDKVLIWVIRETNPYRSGLVADRMQG